MTFGLQVRRCTNWAMSLSPQSTAIDVRETVSVVSASAILKLYQGFPFDRNIEKNSAIENGECAFYFINYTISKITTQLASPVKSGMGFVRATPGTVGLPWAWASPVKWRTKPITRMGRMWDSDGICMGMGWSRNRQTGLARSNPIWAPYGLANWVVSLMKPLDRGMVCLIQHYSDILLFSILMLPTGKYICDEISGWQYGFGWH